MNSLEKYEELPVTDRKVKIPSFVISTELEDSVVVVNLNTKRYYILNSTAGFIWRGITQGNCESEIIDRMAVEYNATKDQITASVDRLFDELERAELIV